MNQTKPYDVAFGAVITNDNGDVLLIQRSRNSSWNPLAWELPGGKPDPGEKASEALLREVFEETGLAIEIESFRGGAFFEHPKINVIMNYFDCLMNSNGEIQLSNEHEAHLWVAPDRVQKLNLTPPAKQTLATE